MKFEREIDGEVTDRARKRARFGKDVTGNKRGERAGTTISIVALRAST